MSENATTFSCDGCQRTYTWKPQLAGKRVKCKCGHTLTVPDAQPDPQIEEDALYDLVAAEEEAAKHAPSQHRVVDAPVSRSAPAASSSGPAIPRSAAGLAIGYRRGPSAEEQKRGGDRFSTANLMDMNRDVHVPVSLLVVGFGIYTAFYAWKYSLGGTGIAAVTFGLGIMTAFKAAL